MTGSVKTTAPLSNVSAFGELVERVMRRKPHLPGLAGFYGYSGYGKTWAACYGAVRYEAHYLEVGRSWTAKRLLQGLVTELGGQARGSIADLVDRAIELLSLTPRPLIIDEFDHVVRNGHHDIIREIHDKVPGATIIVIGEEMLPHLLGTDDNERWDNRVFAWVPAQPADVADARHLAEMFHPEIVIGDDLLTAIVERAKGRLRRICLGLQEVSEVAAVLGLAEIGLQEWGDRPLRDSRPPAPRKAA